MGLFRKKPTETPKKTKPELNEPAAPRVITAEGWRRKILGKPTEVISKKR